MAKKKFKIIKLVLHEEVSVVEAETKEEVEELFINGEISDWKEIDGTDEQNIIEIKEINNEESN